MIYFSAAIVIFLCWGDLQAEQALTFVFGIMLSEYKQEIKSIAPRTIRLCSLLFLFCTILLLAAKQIPIVRDSFDISLLFHSIQLLLKTLLAFAVIFGLWFMKWLQRNNFVYFTGAIFFEIYLIHLFVVPNLIRYCELNNVYFQTILFFVLTYTISYLFHKWNTLFVNKVMQLL